MIQSKLMRRGGGSVLYDSSDSGTAAVVEIRRVIALSCNHLYTFRVMILNIILQPEGVVAEH